MMTVRVDKWLQIARIFKTRSQAANACKLGRVRVNGQPAKAHRALALDDRIIVAQGDWERILIVRELRDKPVPKAEAANLYEDHSPPRPRPDPLDRVLRAASMVREKGKGRPTKKERRQIKRLQGK